MALFLEAWQHVVQWYYWMAVLLCKIYSTHEMLKWFPSTSWSFICTCFLLGFYKNWNLETEEYCYFVKGGQTAREESALGRRKIENDVSLIYFCQARDLWWSEKNCFFEKCHATLDSRNSLKTPKGHWRRAQMAEWQLNDVLLRAPWKRSQTAISPTFSVLYFSNANQTYVDWIISGLMYVLGANITSPLKGGRGHSFCSSNKSRIA